MRRWAWALLLAAVACGGKAVIDGSDTGGGGSGGTGNGPGPGPGPTTNVTSTSSSMTTACQAACAAISNCSQLDCLNSCPNAAPGCEAPRDTFLDCYVASTNAELCTMPADCVSELIAFLDCENRTTDVGCSGGGQNECGCFGDDGMGRSYETFCFGLSGTSRCECHLDGQLAGECVHEGPVFDACDPYFGCCAGLLFIP